MRDRFNLYMDDSGTRHPDRELGDSGRPDWFALGGVLVRQADAQGCHDMLEHLCREWDITKPLHSVEIRHKTKNFRWLRDEGKRQEFLTQLQSMILAMPLYGVACVIDRIGYHRRFHEQYGSQKWSLCKSAFHICVERAAKFVRAHGGRMNVYVERSDHKTDEQLETYFHELKRGGHPFDRANAAPYAPLSQAEIAETLYDFKTKRKQSPMMQIADLLLYPMCQGGYDPNYYPLRELRVADKLIDCHVGDPNVEGIKYYCFGRTQKTEAES